MEIRQLKYYLQVCTDLNMSKAASHLYITQQALSQSMKNMEDELDAVLFTRNNHGVVLTEIGILVKNDVQKFIDEYDLLLQKIQFNTKVLKGSLRLAIPPGAITAIIPTILDGFNSIYPDVNLNIVELSDYGCEELVTKGKVDIAVSVLPIDKDKFDFVPIGSYLPYVCVNKKNHLSSKSSISFSDLKNEKFVIISDDYKWHNTIIEKCKSCGFTPNIVYTSSQVDLLAKLVERNLGISFFIEPVAHSMKNENLVMIPISSIDDFRYELGFVLCSKQKTQKYSAGLLIDYVNRNCNKLK